VQRGKEVPPPSRFCFPVDADAAAQRKMSVSANPARPLSVHSAVKNKPARPRAVQRERFSLCDGDCGVATLAPHKKSRKAFRRVGRGASGSKRKSQ
jgi:hypothetical protein